MWYVYMLRCSDGSLYTGVTTDLTRRLTEHKEGRVGARYTRAKIPLHIAYHETADSRSEAQSREYVLKKMKKEEKEVLAKPKKRSTLTKKRKK
jgi:putative endonuclease